MNARGAGFSLRRLTPAGRGAVSVVEFAGPLARSALAQVCPTAELRLANGAGPHLVRLRSQHADLDEALLVARSVDRYELHLHGNPLLVEELVSRWPEAARVAPCEVAAPRAALEARALAALERCPSRFGARILLDQAQGALRRELEALRRGSPNEVDEALQRLHARYARARFALVPPRVVLAGAVNAGKSTLFNLLVGRARTISHALPGTTRDGVAESVSVGGFAIELWDTPGFWLANDGASSELPSALDRAAVDATRTLLEGADLALWLADAAQPALFAPPASEQRGPLWRTIVTKIDCRKDFAGGETAHAAISAKERPDEALRLVLATLAAALALDPRVWEPGAGMPFDEHSAELLRRIARATPGAAREREWRRALDAASGEESCQPSERELES